MSICQNLGGAILRLSLGLRAPTSIRQLEAALRSCPAGRFSAKRGSERRAVGSLPTKIDLASPEGTASAAKAALAIVERRTVSVKIPHFPLPPVWQAETLILRRADGTQTAFKMHSCARRGRVLRFGPPCLCHSSGKASP